jgi:hypothetical protein
MLNPQFCTDIARHEATSGLSGSTQHERRSLVCHLGHLGLPRCCGLVMATLGPREVANNTGLRNYR